MSAPTDELIYSPAHPAIRISLEPAFNAIYSLLLLSKTDDYSDLGEWVVHTALAMSDEERQRNKLVLIGFYYAVAPIRSWPGFPEYLHYLETVDPQVLVDQMLRTYAFHRLGGEDPQLTVPEIEARLAVVKRDALRSVDAYLDFLRHQFGANHIDPEIETHAYSLVKDPPAMQKLIVAHLRTMWDRFLAPEWKRARPLLQEAAQALQGMDLSKMSRGEVCHTITGQNLSDVPWKELYETTPNVIYVPNPHAGTYLGCCRTINTRDTMWVFYRPRLPRGAELKETELSRSEIIIRLGALADDSRLQIMKYIAAHGETRAQELIQALGLSQSAASRHLMQLSATGYLVERRCNGAKCYAINSEQIEETLKAISGFLQENPDAHS